MSTTSNQPPTQEQVREARRQGFANTVSHMPEADRDRFVQSYHTQDDRRERKVSDFQRSVLAGKDE